MWALSRPYHVWHLLSGKDKTLCAGSIDAEKTTDKIPRSCKSADVCKKCRAIAKRERKLASKNPELAKHLEERFQPHW
jgi:hypothetical protein